MYLIRWSLLTGLVLLLAIPALAQDSGFEVTLNVLGERTLTAPEEVVSLATTFGGRVAAGTREGRLVVWRNGGSPLIVRAHSGAINAVRFSPDGRLVATAGEDGIVALWTVGKDGLARADAFEKEKNPKAVTLAFSHDSQAVVAGFEKGVVKVWGVNAPRAGRTFDRRKARVIAVGFRPKDANTVFSVGEDKILSTWNLSTGEQSTGEMDLHNEAERKGTEPDYYPAAVAEDGSRIVIPAHRLNYIGNYSGTIEQTWIKVARPTGEQFVFNENRLNVGQNKRPPLGISPDGRLLAIASESEKRKNVGTLWNLAKRAPVGNFTLKTDIRYIAVGPTATGYQVTAASGRTISVYPIDLSRTEEPTDTLAVLDLVAEDAKLGSALADVVRSEVTRRNRYIVLNTGNLKELQDEFNLSETDETDEKGKLQTGKLLLAKKNVLGSIHKIGEQFQLTLRLIDKESQRQLWSGDRTCSAATEDALIPLAQALAREMLEAAPSGQANFSPLAPIKVASR